MNVAKGQTVISGHYKIVQESQCKSYLKAKSWQFLQTAHYVMLRILFRFCSEHPEGSSEKKKANEGTEAMDKSLLHHAPSMSMLSGRVFQISKRHRA